MGLYYVVLPNYLALPSSLVVAELCSIQYVRNAFDQTKELSFFFNFSEPPEKTLDLSIEHMLQIAWIKNWKMFAAQDGLSRSQGWTILRILFLIFIFSESMSFNEERFVIRKF